MVHTMLNMHKLYAPTDTHKLNYSGDWVTDLDDVWGDPGNVARLPLLLSSGDNYNQYVIVAKTLMSAIDA